MSTDSQAPVLALVGVGRWGRHILRDLVSLGCEVHAVARSHESIARAREFGAASISPSIEELPAVNGAVAAPITTEHAAVVRRLAHHTSGPIFCEKPLTADPLAAEQLVELCGDRLFVMDKWRYHEGILEMARLAKSGELGRIQGIAMRRVTTRTPHPDVNTLWTHLPHDLSIAIEVLGEIPPLTHAVGEFVADELRGATSILGSDPWVAIEVSDCAPDLRRETRVVGSNAVAILDGGWAEHVTVRRFNGEDEQIATPGELPLLAELRAFVSHVTGGPPPKSSAAEGLAVVRRVQEVIDRASEQGR